MPDTDYVPAISPEEDEQQKKYRYAPVASGSMAPAPDMPPVLPPSGNDTTLNSLAVTSPNMPARVPTPAEGRLKTLTDQGAPPVQPLHGWKKAFDVIGQSFGATRGLEQALRYAPQRNYSENLGQAEKDVTGEQAAITEPMNIRKAQAETDTKEAQANAIKNPAPKPKEELWKTVPNVVGPNGQVLQEEQNSGQIRWAPGITGAGPVKPGAERPDTPEQQFIDEYQKTHAGATVAQAVQAYSAATQKPEREPGNYVPVNDKAGNTIGWVDPKSGHFRSASEIPGLTGATGGPTIPAKPTMQMRNVAAQAQVAADGIPLVVSEVDKLGEQLGPVMGRWNEFMQAGVGANNPELAGLRADLMMVSTAVALAHARGRLPENLREEFDHAINAPKQTPENLKAVLNHILPWMQRMQNTMQGGEAGGGEGSSLQPPKAADPGMKWQHRTTNGKTEWRQVKQ